MKKYSSISILAMLLLSVVIYSCNKTNELSLGQKGFIAKKGDILRMSKVFSEKNEWILTEVNFLKAEDDPEVEIGKNEVDGLLVFEYYNSKDKNFFKTGYFKFKKNNKPTDSYIIFGGFAQSCSGVNCSKCVLHQPWMKSGYCSCERIGDPTAGPSYCNHIITNIFNPNDITSPKQSISNLIIDNPKKLIQEVNEAIMGIQK